MKNNNSNINTEKTLLGKFIKYRLLTHSTQKMNEICGTDIEKRFDWDDNKCQKVFDKVNDYIASEYDGFDIEFFVEEFERCVNLFNGTLADEDCVSDDNNHRQSSKDKLFGKYRRDNRRIVVQKLFLWRYAWHSLRSGETRVSESHYQEWRNVAYGQIDADSEICNVIYNRDTDTEYYNTAFIMLLGWGLIKPKLKQDKDSAVEDNVSQLRDMLQEILSIVPTGVLFDEMPIVRHHLDIIDRMISDGESMSILDMWKVVSDIGDAVEINDSVNNINGINEDIDWFSKSIPGIYKDDVDDGEDRFWIFPDDTSHMLCCRFNGSKMEITPFELIFYSSKYLNDEWCAINSAHVLERILIGESINNKDGVVANYEIEFFEGSDEISALKLYPRKCGNFANDFPYRTFTRMTADDECCKRIIDLIKEANSKPKLEPGNELDWYISHISCNYSNLFCLKNALIGLDNHWLYLRDYDKRQPIFRLRLKRNSVDEFLFSEPDAVNQSNLIDAFSNKCPVICIDRNQLEAAQLVDSVNTQVFIVRRKSRIDDNLTDYIVFGNLSHSYPLRRFYNAKWIDEYYVNSLESLTSSADIASTK